MLVNMLKAVTQMISSKKKNSDIKLIESSDHFEARISCAKVMLDEIIKSMEGGWKSSETVTGSELTKIIPQPEPKPELKPKPQGKDGEYEIVLNADRTISEIKNLPLDAKVEIDGKIMQHKDAIGKTFTTGRVL